MTFSRLKRRTAVARLLVVLVGLGCLPRPAHAHNERVHQGMTSYAYDVMLAIEKFQAGQYPLLDPVAERLALLKSLDPSLGTLYQEVAAATPKLRGLASGLPEDDKPCNDPDLQALVGGTLPVWPTVPPQTLAESTMPTVIFPITKDYANDNSTCAIDKNWQPPAILAPFNPGSFTQKDHTGVTLGYWAAGPDREGKDWIMRSTTLEFLQDPVVSAGTQAGVTAGVTFACLIGCGLFPFLCPACPIIGGGAGQDYYDAIHEVDASAIEDAENFSGLGHFVDVKPLAPGTTSFDVMPGKFSERAGPSGNPDFMEDLAAGVMSLGGLHVRHDLSLAPTNYEIFVAGTATDDFHPDTIDRSAGQWEGDTADLIQYTPVDNLGMFGWQVFKTEKALLFGDDAAATRRLGWPLHALGDATVPMHAVGASGHGHRPYEDSIDDRLSSLLILAHTVPEDQRKALDLVEKVVKRAHAWRQFVASWRAANGNTKDVPVRDLVTALAEQSRGKAAGVSGVYNPDASSTYFFADEADAKAAYSSSALVAFQQDTVIDGIAASLALLTSATEVLP